MIITLEKLNEHGWIDLGDSVIARIKDDIVVVSYTGADKQSQLSIPVRAGSTYLFEGHLPFSLAGTASGYKFTLAGPTMSEVTGTQTLVDGVTKAINRYVHETSSFHSFAGALAQIGDHEANFRGSFTPSADGEFYVRFSQNVSDPAAITLKKGGYLQITKIG